MILARSLFAAILSLTLVLGATGCSPEVGSDKWCAQLEDKPKGDWTANEAADFAKQCLF